MSHCIDNVITRGYTGSSPIYLTPSNMSTLQVRIDKKTKKTAKKILDSIGLDMSSAVKIYFRQIVIVKGLPFQPLTENGLTEKQEQEILKASEEAKKGINVSGPFSTAKEIIDHLNSLK
jgi:DNA-damage-inducible protein J